MNVYDLDWLGDTIRYLLRLWENAPDSIKPYYEIGIFVLKVNVVDGKIEFVVEKRKSDVSG